MSRRVSPFNRRFRAVCIFPITRRAFPVPRTLRLWARVNGVDQSDRFLETGLGESAESDALPSAHGGGVTKKNAVEDFASSARARGIPREREALGERALSVTHAATLPGSVEALLRASLGPRARVASPSASRPPARRASRVSSRSRCRSASSPTTSSSDERRLRHREPRRGRPRPRRDSSATRATRRRPNGAKRLPSSRREDPSGGPHLLLSQSSARNPLSRLP